MRIHDIKHLSIQELLEDLDGTSLTDAELFAVAAQLGLVGTRLSAEVHRRQAGRPVPIVGETDPGLDGPKGGR